MESQYKAIFTIYTCLTKFNFLFWYIRGFESSFYTVFHVKKKKKKKLYSCLALMIKIQHMYSHPRAHVLCIWGEIFNSIKIFNRFKKHAWRIRSFLYKEALLVKEWYSFHLSWKKLDNFHLKDFFYYKCGLYLKQLLTSPQCKVIVAYRTSTIDLPLKMDGGWLSPSIEMIDNVIFALIM